MDTNTAEKLYYGNTAQANPEPQVNPDVAPQTNPVELPGRVSVSPFEKMLVSVCALVVLFMMVTLVYTKIQVTNAQHELQNVGSQITKVNSQNTSNKQVIDNLTASDHVQQVAQKSGMSINSDIRNVNK